MYKEKSTLTHKDYFYRDRLCGKMIHLLDESECGDKVRFYSIVTMNPGADVGYHQHNHEWEVFYVLTGTGEINDNGNIVQVSPGDVITTPVDGWHGFKNTGDKDFTFLALIVKQ